MCANMCGNTEHFLRNTYTHTVPTPPKINKTTTTQPLLPGGWYAAISLNPNLLIIFTCDLSPGQKNTSPLSASASTYSRSTKPSVCTRVCVYRGVCTGVCVQGCVYRGVCKGVYRGSVQYVQRCVEYAVCSCIGMYTCTPCGAYKYTQVHTSIHTHTHRNHDTQCIHTHTHNPPPPPHPPPTLHSPPTTTHPHTSPPHKHTLPQPPPHTSPKGQVILILHPQNRLHARLINLPVKHKLTPQPQHPHLL